MTNLTRQLKTQVLRTIPAAWKNAVPAVPPPTPRNLWLTLAAAVAEDLLLDAAADVVDGGVGELDGVEVVDHDGGVTEVGEEPVDVAAMRVERHRPDGPQPGSRAGVEPAGDGAGDRVDPTGGDRDLADGGHATVGDR